MIIDQPLNKEIVTSLTHVGVKPNTMGGPQAQTDAHVQWQVYIMCCDSTNDRMTSQISKSHQELYRSESYSSMAPSNLAYVEWSPTAPEGDSGLYKVSTMVWNGWCITGVSILYSVHDLLPHFASRFEQDTR